jgi:hypothetical protein
VEFQDTDGAVIRNGEPLTDLLFPATAQELTDRRPGTHVPRLVGEDADGGTAERRGDPRPAVSGSR